MRKVKLIKRSFYLNQLKSVLGTPDIKIITGIRRSGKSKLLEAFIKEIKKTDEKANIIHINYSLLKFEKIMEYHSLAEYVEENYKPRVHNFVMIDEVQMCPDFEKAINSLHASEKYDIYVTSSSAFLLSSDLATLFTGRTFEIKVYPFSFAEYMTYYGYKNQYEGLQDYMKQGGMAGSYAYNSLEEKYKYIEEDVFNALVVRDILQKYGIRNTTLLKQLIDFLMDNIANITSGRTIATVLAKNGNKTNDKTVKKYIEYLCRAFAFYKVRRYDIRGKRYLAFEDKYYVADQAFRYARLGTRNDDSGRTLENIVAMELLRRGYEVYVGMLYKKEIDFVALKQSEKFYLQVSDDISDDKTFSREVESLLKIKDAYPKILLARTRREQYQYEGIKIIDIADWLLENK